MHYYTGYFINQYIKKGIYYIMLSSKNNNRHANFVHGFLLHEGKYIEQNIEEAVHYYKEASSFNIHYAKNNLGIIYKHEYSEIEGEVRNAIVYFEEAIRQKNDFLSMYNLAHIYIYEHMEDKHDKAIELLVKSSDKFYHSFILLCLFLFKLFGFYFEKIKQELEKYTDKVNELTTKINIFIQDNIIFGESVFDQIYESYRTKEFLYNHELQIIPTTDLEKVKEMKKQVKYPNAKNISSKFYDGFGHDLLEI